MRVGTLRNSAMLQKRGAVASSKMLPSSTMSKMVGSKTKMDMQFYYSESHPTLSRAYTANPKSEKGS